MASWTIAPQQTVRVRARATRLIVVGDARARAPAPIGDGYDATAAHAPLLLERFDGRFACLRGHHVRSDREMVS